MKKRYYKEQKREYGRNATEISHKKKKKKEKNIQNISLKNFFEEEKENRVRKNCYETSKFDWRFNNIRIGKITSAPTWATYFSSRNLVQYQGKLKMQP